MKPPVLVHADRRVRPFLLLAALLSVAAGLLVRWTISDPSPPVVPGVPRSQGSAVAGTADFTIDGDLPSPLAPGLRASLPLVISNPNAFPIEVTRIVVTVAAVSSRHGCDGPANIEIRQAGDAGSARLVLPPGGSVRLPAQGIAAPVVAMRNLETNQDACKRAGFELVYDGVAVEAGR